MRRVITIAAPLLVLGTLTYYGYRAYPELRLSTCLQDPLRYDGAHLVVGTEATVEALVPNGFVIRQLGRSVCVVGDPGDARVGDFVRMEVIFHKEGYLTLKRLYVAKKRRAKIAVSVLPVLVVGVWFCRAYRFDRRCGYLVERK
ncbi:MAG: hypothetical protein ONB30_05350 [candidate division KSB1 bacterium]|nr:hypothetical protein [candidate division KSB1 bacterium]